MTRLYMVLERFRGGDAAPVYERYRERGRMMPQGVEYVDSWVDDGLTRCFQLMRADDRALLDEWIANWDDLVEFEVVPVMSSADANASAGGADRA